MNDFPDISLKYEYKMLQSYRRYWKRVMKTAMVVYRQRRAKSKIKYRKECYERQKNKSQRSQQ